MDSIIYVIQSIFRFIWTIIVGIFDILGWIIDRLVDAYHWCINTYQWFMELDTLYKIIFGVALIVLWTIGFFYQKAKRAKQHREAEEFRKIRAEQFAKEKEKKKAEKAAREAENRKQNAIRLTCPKCNKIDALRYVENKVIERYQGNKEVREKTAKGDYKTRYIKCMKQVEDVIWGCKYCDFTRVEETITRDLD